MKRISNRSHESGRSQAPQVHYIHVEPKVETVYVQSEPKTETIYIKSEPEMVEKVVYVNVPMQSETVYVKADAPDLTYINDAIGQLVQDQAEMVDRIIQLQEELDSLPEEKPEKSLLVFKLVIGLSLVISTLSIFLR